MKKRTIFHLITGMGVGGTEMMLLKTVPELEKYYQNVVIALLDEGPIGQELTQKGIPVYYLKLRSGLVVGAAFRFYRLIRQYRPNLLITYLIHADLFGRIFGRLFGIRRVACSQRGSLQGWDFLRHFDRWTSGLVNCYLTQTEIAKREIAALLHLPLERFQVVPNAVLTEQFDGPADPIGVRQEFGLPNQAQILLCVANLLPGKGHDYLIGTFTELALHYPYLYLFLAGEGKLRPEIERQIAASSAGSRIKLLGSRRDIPRLLKASTAFVFPSLSEGMSNALLEAMAAEIPVLASDIAVNQEIIQSGKNGLTFAAGNSEALALVLQEVLDHPGQARVLALAGRQTIRERYEINQVVEQLVKVIESI